MPAERPHIPPSSLVGKTIKRIYRISPKGTSWDDGDYPGSYGLTTTDGSVYHICVPAHYGFSGQVEWVSDAREGEMAGQEISVCDFTGSGLGSGSGSTSNSGSGSGSASAGGANQPSRKTSWFGSGSSGSSSRKQKNKTIRLKVSGDDRIHLFRGVAVEYESDNNGKPRVASVEYTEVYIVEASG